MSWVVPYHNTDLYDRSPVSDLKLITAKSGLNADRNEESYVSIVRDRNEMKLFFDHDVVFNMKLKRETSRRHAGKDEKRWRRIVSFIDVKLQYINSLGGLEKSESWLNALMCHTRFWRLFALLRPLFTTPCASKRCYILEYA